MLSDIGLKVFCSTVGFSIHGTAASASWLDTFYIDGLKKFNFTLSFRYGHEKVQFSIDSVSCPSGLLRGFRNVGAVRLTDCAHEFGSSLCDAFIAHFDGV